MAGPERSRAYAPASVGNVGVGFDILGHALDAVGDVVEATRGAGSSVTVAKISGVVADLPTNVADNTAGRAVEAMWQSVEPGFSVSLSIDKGIPLGSGMGGSAASAVAAVVAANGLLDAPLSPHALLPFALAGEAVASGSAHVDNVAASLFGGLVFAYRDATSTRIRQVAVAPGLRCVLVHPACEIQTRDARGALSSNVDLATVVESSANLAGFLLACPTGDADLLRASLRDVLIEPQRAHLLPGFADVKASALGAGALGCSLSGSGPSVFAWVEEGLAERVAGAMVDAFARNGLASDYWISPINARGARTVEASS